MASPSDPGHKRPESPHRCRGCTIQRTTLGLLVNFRQFGARLLQFCLALLFLLVFRKCFRRRVILPSAEPAPKLANPEVQIGSIPIPELMRDA